MTPPLPANAPMTNPTQNQEHPERLRTRRFGWWSLAAWASLGVVLETAHGMKLSAVLDDPLTRELLRWAHAHGVGLSLVVLAYAAVGGGPDGPTAATRRVLQAGALLLPLGFGLGGLWHYESDPGLGIVLAPLGGLAVLVGLWRAAREVSAG